MEGFLDDGRIGTFHENDLLCEYDRKGKIVRRRILSIEFKWFLPSLNTLES